MAGVLLGGALAGTSYIPVLGLALVLVVISHWDDSHGLSVPVRLGSHLLIAVVFLSLIAFDPFLPHSVSLVGEVRRSSTAPGLIWSIASLWWLAAGALATAWMTNLYNFMDGSDGLAGGMTLIGFAFYGIAAALAGDSGLAVLSFCISAAALVFLFFNFHPARIFMGDSGSVPLGFLAAALGILGWRNGDWPLWFPLLVFSPFIVDASVTLLKRLARREKVWEAHRDHYYQRLVRAGLGHRNTALAEYALMLLCGCSGLSMLKLNATNLVIALAVWLLIYAGLAFATDRFWLRHLSAGVAANEP
jgi:UDP-N-acetylmuramyl pentapeptide phosphotransferase/UDP-N-acetylglucosamine-1-phosphate transferase